MPPRATARGSIKVIFFEGRMKKETVKQYTILYQYLLLLKEPTYIFLIQVFQHLSPSKWWEDYIEPVLQHENKENFKYLDMADLLNVFKMNWESIFKYLDKRYRKYKYDNEYKLVSKAHRIRTMVAHANDIDMSPLVFVDCLSCLLDYSKLILADEALVQKLELDWMKHCQLRPEKQGKVPKEETLRADILSIIENRVLLKAISCDALPPDIKLSIDRTTLRLHSMRTSEEIIGFFNNAIRGERGVAVHAALHKEGLLGFEDIKDEINRIYRERIAEGENNN
jgi:hypothetical protein